MDTVAKGMAARMVSFPAFVTNESSIPCGYLHLMPSYPSLRQWAQDGSPCGIIPHIEVVLSLPHGPAMEVGKALRDGDQVRVTAERMVGERMEQDDGTAYVARSIRILRKA
jgi:hypothetical protein